MSMLNIFNVSGSAASAQSQRLNVVASNIANADTPGYVARDIDFSQALRNATGAMNPASVMASSQAGHLGGSAATTEANLVYAMPSQTNLDRNTVDMDRERANFTDNSVKYEATLRFITNNVRTMLSAITGQ